MKKSTLLREILKQDGILTLPGVPAPLFAKLVQDAGYKAVYMSGAAVSNMNFGMSDYNLVTMTENLGYAKRINDAVDIPVLCDIDNGYGGAINVYRTAKEFSKAGIAAIQLEDQEIPKRCGHFEDHVIIPTEEMCGKIRAAKDGSEDGDMMLIARTDAISATGSVDEAVERMHRYVESGADAVFIEAIRTEEDMRRIPKEFGGIPVIVNLVEGGKTPMFTDKNYEEMGFKIALYAAQTLKAAIMGVENILEYIKRHGTTAGSEDVIMVSSARRHEITNKSFYRELTKKYQ